mmetsp:Transcript_83453/g.212510  ORF Transcript_83453/g.212510 Transcript_83453/m.212510 type:complete len:213 (-) Transcript_83453:1880-2518(-)
MAPLPAAADGITRPLPAGVKGVGPAGGAKTGVAALAGADAPGLMMPIGFGPDDESATAAGAGAAPFPAAGAAATAAVSADSPGLMMVAWPCGFVHFEAPHFAPPQAPAPSAVGGPPQPCCCWLLHSFGCSRLCPLGWVIWNEPKMRPFNLSWAASSPRSRRSKRLRRASSANLAKTAKVSMSSESWLCNTDCEPRYTVSMTSLTISAQPATP